MRVHDLASYSSRREDRRDASLPPEDELAPASSFAPNPDPSPPRRDRDDDGYANGSGELISLDPNQPVVFVGFDDTKLRSPLRLGKDGLPTSAKYTFAKLAMTSRTMPHTKPQAEDWFNEHSREGMETRGFRVGWVRGDEALISTRERPEGELITFVRGAGSGIKGYIALTWENEATRAAQIEVTELSDDPIGTMNDPLMKVQREIALSLAREEQEQEQRLQDELQGRLKGARRGGRW
jgi:hypothetical protein